MTKQEVTDKLNAKLVANRDTCKLILEQIAETPGALIKAVDGRNLLTVLSETWKEGQAIRELASELVGILYQDEARAPEQTVLQ